MLCQLSYVVKSVRVDDISELSLVPLNKEFNNHIIEYTNIEGTSLSSEISSTRTNLNT